MIKKGLIGFLGGLGLFILLASIGLYFMTKKVSKIVADVEKENEKVDFINTIPKNSSLNLISFPNQIKDTLLFSNNKVVFVNFWATWCKPCIEEMDEIEKLYKSKRDNVNFYIVSTENFQEVEKFLVKRKWNLPFYTMKDSVSFLKYKGIPRTYIIKNNTIYLSHLGKNKWNHKKVQDFLSGLED
jgi:thiol-disulfide isomerase/thioredoxin